MTDKAKIRAEIEKRYRDNKADGYSDVCEELWDILSFIDSMQEDPVSESINFEQELYKAFGQVKDFTLCMRIAKRFYDMGKNSQEPVSEELEEAGKKWLSPQLDKSYAAYGETKQMELTHFDGYAMLDAIEFGAQWQQAKDSIPAEYLEEAAKNYAFTMSGEDEVLKHDAFIEGAQWQKQKDSMPVSEDLEEAVNAYIGYAPEVDESSSTYGKRQAFKAGAQWQKTKDESTTEDLGEYINELSKQFPEVSFAKLSRIGVRVAKWQRKEIYEWIRTHKDEYVYNSPYDSFDIEQCIIDLKQAMKDE